MAEDLTDVPTLWNDESDDRLKCTHSLADVKVEVKGISSGEIKVEERGKYSRGGDPNWDVVVSHGERELKHGERKSTEAEAEELAIGFMNEFDENYEGETHGAYVETLESR